MILEGARRRHSRCGTARRNRQLARNVTALLRQSAEPVSICACIVDVDVALVVQRPEQFIHPLERRGDKSAFSSLLLVPSEM